VTVFGLARDGGNQDECGVDLKLRHLLFLHGGVFHLRRRDDTFLGGICLLVGLWGRSRWCRLWVGDRRMSTLMLSLFFVGLRTRCLLLLAWLVSIGEWMKDEGWRMKDGGLGIYSVDDKCLIRICVGQPLPLT